MLPFLTLGLLAANPAPALTNPICPASRSAVDVAVLQRQVKRAQWADEASRALQGLGLLETQEHVRARLTLDVFAASVFAPERHPVLQLRGSLGERKVRTGVALVPLADAKVCVVSLPFLAQEGAVVFRFRQAVTSGREAIEVDNPFASTQPGEGDTDSGESCASTSLWVARGFGLEEILRVQTSCVFFGWAPGYSSSGTEDATLSWSDALPLELTITKVRRSKSSFPDGRQATEESTSTEVWRYRDGKYSQ